MANVLPQVTGGSDSGKPGTNDQHIKFLLAAFFIHPLSPEKFAKPGPAASAGATVTLTLPPYPNVIYRC
jgi:hypothetical protein